MSEAERLKCAQSHTRNARELLQSVAHFLNSPPAYHAPPPPLLPLLSPLSLSLFRCTASGFYRCISVCCVFRTLFSSWQLATGWVTSSIPHPANHAPTPLPPATCLLATLSARIYELARVSVCFVASVSALALSNPSIFSKKLCTTLEWGLVFK